MNWLYSIDEGKRGDAAPRKSCRDAGLPTGPTAPQRQPHSLRHARYQLVALNEEGTAHPHRVRHERHRRLKKDDDQVM